MNNEFFSFDEFKKWMAGQDSPPELNRPAHNDKFIGLEVGSRVSAHKLTEKIEVLEGVTLEVARDFKSNGGRVKNVVEDFNFIIEVDSGLFSIHRCYTTKI